MVYLHHWPNVIPDSLPFLFGLYNEGKEFLMLPVFADLLNSEDVGL